MRPTNHAWRLRPSSASSVLTESVEKLGQLPHMAATPHPALSPLLRGEGMILQEGVRGRAPHPFLGTFPSPILWGGARGGAREGLFGEIAADILHLNELGLVVEEEWLRTQKARTNIRLDEFIVMPNHLHGILVIADGRVGANRRLAPTTASNRIVPAPPSPNSVGAIMAQIKSVVAKRVNALRNSPGVPVWQRNYYEHIVRDLADLDRIRTYISNNPFNWQTDQENPAIK